MVMSDNTGGGENDETKSEGAENAGSSVGASGIPTLSPETVFELFGDRHRRAVFAYLENTDNGRASVSDLAAHVAQHACADDSPSQITVHLHHKHLPKIDAANLIDYDREHETVRYVGHPLVEDCLDLVDREQR